VLNQTPKEAHGRKLTAAMVASAFVDKATFFSALAASYISADNIIGGLRQKVGELIRDHDRDGPGLRHALVQKDFANMLEPLAETRHWFASHAEAADPLVHKQLVRVYDAFDDLLEPVYEMAGHWEGRVPKDGLEWTDVAAALTALTEGATMRRHLGHDRGRPIPWVIPESACLAVLVAEGIWDGTTKKIDK